MSEGLIVNPLIDLGSRLLEVEKPARYTGGEYGIYKKTGVLKTAIVFPDLYELGMANQAFRIIYNGLNQIKEISCDRAFAPAPDFEELLKEQGLPLYGLDTGIALNTLDILLFTLGYELGITGILSVLDCSCIALRAKDRGNNDPIVIMGGPCVSNPLPYSLFIDAFWIGEAEAGFFDLACELLQFKKKGVLRKDMLDKIAEHPHIWIPGKTGVRRAVFSEFAKTINNTAVFPISNIKTAHQHGAVEIMRGCPNGCRFCHAGFWYRPMRQKDAAVVMEEVQAFVEQGGYREISLSSLSSGDYCHITDLTTELNRRYNSRHVSFQLPSLRVSGFSLPLLSDVSKVRKSGLTFAVETPCLMNQKAINKEVPIEEVIAIIKEAKKYGWKGAKFYFMLGIPLGIPGLPNDVSKIAISNTTEEESIVNFILEAAKATSSHFTVNVGTFVPKPHTPYQNCAQLDEETAWRKIHYIQDKLKPRGHKVSTHNPFVSVLEGVFARGTETAGLIAEQAYLQGCRLDAWKEYIKINIWRELFSKNPTLVQESLKAKDNEQNLPWAVINSGVGEGYLNNEYKRSVSSQITTPCKKECNHKCGVCANVASLVTNDSQVKTIVKDLEKSNHGQDTLTIHRKTDKKTYRMLFAFSKQGTAVLIPHLGVIELFASAAMRAGLSCTYTQGFNPLLRIDFAAPAPVGLSCKAEIACIDMEQETSSEEFLERLNPALPEGFLINKAQLFVIPTGVKKHSVASLLWGGRYGDTIIPAKEEKKYRASTGKNLFELVRDEVLAKDKTEYFSIYRGYYG